MLKEKAIKNGLEFNLSLSINTIDGIDVKTDIFSDDITRVRIDVTWYVENCGAIRKAEEGGNRVLAKLHIR